MNRFKVVASIFCLSLAALAFSSGVKADAWNKKTIVSFNQPVEVPGGVVLPAGAYVFKLLDSASNRHIVQIFDRDQTHVHATILAIPNYRLDVTGKTVITFWERAAGDPQAIRAWFYPGDNFGQEFVYPKKRAVELAKITDSPSPAMPTELESEITKPAESVNDEPVVALKQAPVIAVKPEGEEVKVAQDTTPPPAQQKEPADTPERTEQLPKTASSLPLLGLIGLLSLGAGLALMLILKRTA